MPHPPASQQTTIREGGVRRALAVRRSRRSRATWVVATSPWQRTSPLEPGAAMTTEIFTFWTSSPM